MKYIVLSTNIGKASCDCIACLYPETDLSKSVRCGFCTWGAGHFVLSRNPGFHYVAFCSRHMVMEWERGEEWEPATQEELRVAQVMLT